MGQYTYNAEGIDADSTGKTVLGYTAPAHPEATLEVVAVVVEQEDITDGNGDAEFNVDVDDDAIFSEAQSVDALDTPERFIPDTDDRFSGSDLEAIEFEVTGADGGTSSAYHVTVVVDDGRG